MARLFSVDIYIVACLLVTICCLDKVDSLDTNISCYQCEQYTNKECAPELLKPCSSNSDRCVTTIIKNKQQGFLLKRQCGLAPCTFEELNMNIGIGFGSCDRMKEEFFCVSCCKGNGCNKNSSHQIHTSIYLMINYMVLLIFFTNVIYS